MRSRSRETSDEQISTPTANAVGVVRYRNAVKLGIVGQESDVVLTFDIIFVEWDL